MNELVREVLREGRLTAAGGGPAALYTPWAAGFEKQYPGITVQVRGAFSNQLVADVDRQLESGAPAVDVAILQTPQDFARWKAAGALLTTDIPAVGQLAPDWRDDDGRYLPVGVYALGYGYDPRQIAASQVPRSAAEVVGPAGPSARRMRQGGPSGWAAAEPGGSPARPILVRSTKTLSRPPQNGPVHRARIVNRCRIPARRPGVGPAD